MMKKGECPQEAHLKTAIIQGLEAYQRASPHCIGEVLSYDIVLFTKDFFPFFLAALEEESDE